MPLANGGAATAIDPSVNGQSLHFPYGVAVDAAGDLFIADANNRIVEVPAGGRRGDRDHADGERQRR